MSSTPFDTPGSADGIFLSLQQRVLRGIRWISIGGAPLLIVIWELHRRRSGADVWLPVTFQIVLLAGLALQHGWFRRRSPRANGYFLMVWFGALASLSQLFSGPLTSNGIAWACTAMLGVFLVHARAGAAVVGAYCALGVLQAAAVHSGWLPGPRDLAPAGGLPTLIRVAVTGLIPLVMCYFAFVLLCQSLAHTLARLFAERQRSETALEAQRAAEQTMRANQHFEALGKLASGVAHDVNNALTTVQCSAELLQQGLAAGDERQLAEDIMHASRAAAQTTRQLLAFSRRAFCTPTPICPAREVEIVARLVARLLPANVRLNVQCSTNRRILADAGDLRQALLNLILNARDAMPHGGLLAITVADHSESDAPHVIIQVADQGSGIPPEILPRIFEPFFTTKPTGRGTGLGLAMVRALAEEVGGTVTVKTSPPHGTIFSLVFPECPQPEPTAAALSDLQGAPAGHLLLVEARDELRAILERVLRRGGYAVSACADSEEACRQLASRVRFDLLCVDSDSDGVLVREFQARFPDAPVLLCTGFPDQEWLREARGRGPLEVLRKPFSGTELLARTRALRPPSALAAHRS